MVVDNPADDVDVNQAFVDKVVPNIDADRPCTGGLPTADTDGDGAADTFLNVLPSPQVCFDVVPKTNQTVAPSGVERTYEATLQGWGNGTTLLDEHRIFFIVPAE